MFLTTGSIEGKFLVHAIVASCFSYWKQSFTFAWHMCYFTYVLLS